MAEFTVEKAEELFELSQQLEDRIKQERALLEKKAEIKKDLKHVQNEREHLERNVWRVSRGMPREEDEQEKTTEYMDWLN